MDGLEFNPVDGPQRPRTTSVLGLIAIAAAVFSYLWSYCLTDALVAAEFLNPLPKDYDPRPKWLVSSWFVLMVVFMVMGYLLQKISSRQLSTIDDMERAEDDWN
jgi:hypothetical protein